MVLSAVFGFGFAGNMTSLSLCVRDAVPANRFGGALGEVMMIAWAGMASSLFFGPNVRRHPQLQSFFHFGSVAGSLNLMVLALISFRVLALISFRQRTVLQRSIEVAKIIGARVRAGG